MSFHECGIDLGNIAEKISSGIERIFAYASGLASEAGKLISHFGEFHICFLRHLFDHHDCLPADLSAELAVFCHLFLDELRSDVKHAAEGERIEFLHLTWSHHQVICDLVPDEDLTVPVVDYASGGVDGSIYHRVVAGIQLVFLVKYLDGEKLGNQDCSGCAQADQEFVLSVKFHPIPSYLLSSGVRMSVTSMARIMLAASDAKKRAVQNQNGRVPAPSRKMYTSRKTDVVAAITMDILPAPFLLTEKLSFLFMMSSPRKILMKVLRSAATGMRDAAFMPISPSESQSTASPLANAISMQTGVLIVSGMHMTMAGRRVSIRYGPSAA